MKQSEIKGQDQPTLSSLTGLSAPLPPLAVGNDWVDFTHGRWLGRGSQDAFILKIATENEARWIAQDPDLRAALIWSAKEAAIKVFQKLAPGSPIRFHDFEVTLPRTLKKKRTSTTIQIPMREDLIQLEWELYAEGVHALCFCNVDGAIAEVRSRVVPNLDSTLRAHLDQTFFSPNELASAYSEASRHVRALAKLCAQEWGLGEVLILRELVEGVKKPPIAIGASGIPIAEIDLSLSHDGPGLAIAWAKLDHFPKSPTPRTH